MEMDLLALAEQDGFRTVRKSMSRGGQFNGPCPFCGGTDRFRIQPNHGTYGWFACNQCGKKGNTVDYLMEKRGYSKRDALQAVGWVPKDGSPLQPQIPHSALEERPQWNEPPERWQEGAIGFYQDAQRMLWSKRGEVALRYLRRRGLKDDTIRKAVLGYNPREHYGTARDWGRPVFLNKGIVIPWFAGGKVWRLTIRDEQVQEGGGRYKQVAGGSNGLYLADSLKLKRSIVVMTEGELDALSIAQECGDQVAVVATGTTQGSHTPQWVGLLARQERVLIAFDAEESGEKAVQWWQERLKNARRLRPWWKDANQMLQDGADLRSWLGLEEEELVCRICGAEVEYYSDQGKAFCEIHWQEQFSCKQVSEQTEVTEPDGLTLVDAPPDHLTEGVAEQQRSQKQEAYWKDLRAKLYKQPGYAEYLAQQELILQARIDAYRSKYFPE